MAEALRQEVLITKHNVSSLPDWQQNLIKKAQEAALKAYAPYSEFQVGAALITEEGNIYTGNNQENSAYPSGLCAERVALFYAHAQAPNEKISCMVITSKKATSENFQTVTPCGSCRQVLSEIEDKQETPIALIMSGNTDEVFISDSIENLLPFRFSNKYLK
jgi:cytidine deaminase